ncbi:hypothetical protein [Gordonia sp. 'Campus']|uniref:hypothetical protein n=1 Tax=Gordonia sp. 'Campus' TaxID=2915824 RepID=UPI001EE3EB1C|nr:hypothetical protein [Gordonia sp. 'Campus']
MPLSRPWRFRSWRSGVLPARELRGDFGDSRQRELNPSLKRQTGGGPAGFVVEIGVVWTGVQRYPLHIGGA